MIVKIHFKKDLPVKPLMSANRILTFSYLCRYILWNWFGVKEKVPPLAVSLAISRIISFATKSGRTRRNRSVKFQVDTISMSLASKTFPRNFISTLKIDYFINKTRCSQWMMRANRLWTPRLTLLTLGWEEFTGQ